MVEKIHRLERAQYAFLDNSNTLVFSDVILGRGQERVRDPTARF